MKKIKDTLRQNKINKFLRKLPGSCNHIDKYGFSLFENTNKRFIITFYRRKKNPDYFKKAFFYFAFKCPKFLKKYDRIRIYKNNNGWGHNIQLRARKNQGVI